MRSTTDPETCYADSIARHTGRFRQPMRLERRCLGRPPRGPWRWCWTCHQPHFCRRCCRTPPCGAARRQASQHAALWRMPAAALQGPGTVQTACVSVLTCTDLLIDRVWQRRRGQPRAASYSGRAPIACRRHRTPRLPGQPLAWRLHHTTMILAHPAVAMNGI